MALRPQLRRIWWRAAIACGIYLLTAVALPRIQHALDPQRARRGSGQSVDRTELGVEIARHAPGARVLVQVNVAGEEQKGGCPPTELPALVDSLTDLGLTVEGLMTVPPLIGDPRPHFAALRDLANRLGLATLSMGMSGDFEAAIAEGSTLVRIGRAVFGPRS